MTEDPTIFVVDDDQAVRDSLRWLLESLRLKVETYASATEFLASGKLSRPGCLVLDVRMPEVSGLQLQEILAAQRVHLPVIIITGHGDVSMAVRAMKFGALDFIEKPFNDQLFLECIQRGLQVNACQRRRDAERQTVQARLASLTARERDVLERVVAGKPNKVIASELGISARTVEVHRAHLMEKMCADSLAALTAMCVPVRREQTALSLDT
jgi:two-component system, LuxR family, response regulator FixJ